VRVYCFASERKQVIIHGKMVDLNEFMTGDAASLSERLDYIRSLKLEPMTNPRDALLHNTKGRYFYFIMQFIGSERQSPTLRKIRVYYPRKSLLSYLPAVYSFDPKSRDFLERFLSLFGSFFMNMEEQIEGIAKYFDPETVSQEYLRWLASWIAIAVDDNLGEEGLKKLIQAAPMLYPLRGTRQGIESMVEIYTGEKPLIVEHFQVSDQRQNPELKELVDRLYSDNPYSFSIMVKRDRVPDEHRYLVVQKMLDQEKPAFTEAKLVVLQPWIYMDMHTYLGINTYLSEISLPHLDMMKTIPYDSMLIDVGQDNRIETHSRMDLDAELR
jgi:phage tail-like protein